jgi:cell division septation protein DedD/nucleoid DNA-binding protein
MKIAPSIIKLLIEDNEVSIRNFGKFYKELQNASIHPITKEATPPYQKLLFDKNKISNPEKIENLLALENNISIEEAQSSLKTIVSQFEDNIKTSRKAEIDDFVELKLNIDESFDVIIKKNVIFDKEYFSLPSFQIQNKPIETPAMEENNNISNNIQPEEKPVENVQNQKVETTDVSQENPIEKKKKKSPIVLILILLLLFGGLGTAGFLFQDDILKLIKGEEKTTVVENKEIEVVEPIIDEYQEDYTEETPVVEEPYVEPAPVVETKPTQTQVSNTTSAPSVDLSSLVYAPKNAGKFYVIAGSFKRIHNAANLVSQLKKQGYNPVVLEADEKGLIRVSYKPGFDNERAARDLADELYEKKNELPWIHKY